MNESTNVLEKGSLQLAQRSLREALRVLRTAGAINPRAAAKASELAGAMRASGDGCLAQAPVLAGLLSRIERVEGECTSGASDAARYAARATACAMLVVVSNLLAATARDHATRLEILAEGATNASRAAANLGLATACLMAGP